MQVPGTCTKWTLVRYRTGRLPVVYTRSKYHSIGSSTSLYSVSANGVLQTWIHGITAGTLCTTRAHGSARATMYTQLAAHGIECGTTYSTCVHCTKLDTAYTLHRLQLVRTSIPAAQLMHSVPTAVPPIPHLSGAGTICDTMHTTCAQGTGADVPCGSLS